jgi:hypothetical protein
MASRTGCVNAVLHLLSQLRDRPDVVPKPSPLSLRALLPCACSLVLACTIALPRCSQRHNSADTTVQARLCRNSASAVQCHECGAMSHVTHGCCMHVPVQNSARSLCSWSLMDESPSGHVPGPPDPQYHRPHTLANLAHCLQWSIKWRNCCFPPPWRPLLQTGRQPPRQHQ